MIKGWKNNPAWVEHYERRDKERRLREIQRLDQQIALQNAASRYYYSNQNLNQRAMIAASQGEEIET